MFRLRPLSLWISAFAAGILCAVFAEGIAEIVLWTVIGVLCVLCVAVRRFPYRTVIIPLCISLLLGMGYLDIRGTVIQSKVSRFENRSVSVTGDVTETDKYGFTLSVVASSGTLDKSTRIRVYYDYEYPVETGDRVYASLSLSDSGKDGYAYGEYLSATGEISRIDSGRSENMLTAVRKYFSSVIDDRFSDFSAGVAKAVLLGNDSEISPELYFAYRRSGISHILVISGFHMSIILMSAYVVLSNTVLGRRYAGIICIALTLLFSLFVGFTPSVSRAAIMCIAVFTGGSLNYKNDSFTSLFIALGILLVVNPYSVFAVGLQLSFLCSLGIITLSPVVERAVAKIKSSYLRFGVKQLTSVVYSAVAALFSFPVIWYSFGEFSVISPISNVLAIPLSGAATVFGYIGIIIPPVSYVSDILFKLINKTAVFFADIPFSTVSTHINGMWIAFAVSLVSVLVVCSVKPRLRIKTLCACMLTFVVCIGACFTAFRITMDDCTVVNGVTKQYCKQTVVVSKSNCAFVDKGGAYIDTDMVFGAGCTRIDDYIMLECDENGLGNLCNAFYSAGRIRKIYIYDKNRDADIYRRVLDLALEWGATVEVFNEDITISVGDAYLTAGEELTIQYYGKSVDYKEQNGLTRLGRKE